MSKPDSPDDVLTSAPSTADIEREARTVMVDAPLPSPRPTLSLPPTPVHVWRARLSKARSGQQVLDALIEPHDAARLIPQLPVDDLHHAIHRIGLQDSEGVLALATGEQVRGLLDTDIWQRDSLSVDRIDPWLTALMRAGPEVLVDKLLALDDGLLNWVVRRSVRTIVVDEPESFDPPDDEHVVTPDGRLCIVFPESATRDLPVKVFLDQLMRDDPALCVNLLVLAEAALDTNLQEDAYRWRTGRMADRGYVDYYDALGIYTAPRADQIRDAQASLPADAPAVERWLVPILGPEARLADAFAALPAESLEVVQGALGYVANMALSADRIEAWDTDAQEETLARLRAGLVLGLDVLAGPDAGSERDAEVLGTVALAMIFRTGYARMLDAAAAARKAASGGRLSAAGDRLGAVDLPALAPWAAALCGRHPETPSGPPTRTEHLTEMRRHGEIIAELALLSDGGRAADEGIGAWLTTWMTRDLIGLAGPGRLPHDRLEDAHRALFADGRLRPDARQAAEHWFARARGEDARALAALLAAVEDAMAAVSPTDLEPRLLPFWLVAPASAR